MTRPKSTRIVLTATQHAFLDKLARELGAPMASGAQRAQDLLDRFATDADWRAIERHWFYGVAGSPRDKSFYAHQDTRDPRDFRDYVVCQVADAMRSEGRLRSFSQTFRPLEERRTALRLA